ncbi:hypothetical protein LSTR_LSTR002650 [Laodelphax striatellus]|uniref:Conserved oligomeric Golgi complex subunit 5 n=1 Tax=Laodelphax striatellus TaxID=195883 RepID=A0A482X697_LAOST|nr:hypothetical protein LSTR_LSTR002650 [Laodelphax striatellus]
MGSSGQTDVWKALEEDEFLCTFLDKSSTKNQAIQQTLIVSEQLSRLTHGITLLEKELQQQVLENHDQLVTQATWVDKLETILSDLQSHTQRLLSSVERLRGKVIEPFNKLETQTVMLARLHATSDLLRRTARIQQLAKRLPTLEPVRASATISELDELCCDVDLSGLQILEDDQRLIRSETARVEKEGQQMLNQGLRSLNQAQVSSAIQVFRNLGILEREMNMLLDKSLNKVQQNAEKALDIQNYNPTERLNKSKGGPGRATGSMYPGNVSNFRNTLWTAWENVLYQVVHSQATQLALIQTVLCKKSNPLSLISDPPDEKNSEIAAIFWTHVNDLLSGKLSKAAESSSFIKQALEGEYPKLLRLHLDLHKKLQAEPLTANIFPDAGRCGHQFETAYLSKSVARLLDSVHSMFANESPPTTEDVDTLIRTVTNELSVSLIEEALSLTVARNIGKAVRLFCLKGEQMLSVRGEATQVIEPPTCGQQLNVSVANIAFYLATQVRRVATNMSATLSPAAVAELTKALGNADHLTKLIINPLLETAISPLCKQLTELGRNYKLLRAFRPLVSAAPQEVADCPLLGDLVPHSLALTCLFSRAPPELPANWSIDRLSQWLDSHKDEKQRLELLSGALQKYQQTVRQQNQQSFHPVYPILMQILEKGFQFTSSKK